MSENPRALIWVEHPDIPDSLAQVPASALAHMDPQWRKADPPAPPPPRQRRAPETPTETPVVSKARQRASTRRTEQ